MVVYNNGPLIRRLRLQSRRSQAELARKIGVGQSYISEIERNRKNPSMAILKKLADILHFSMDEFFGSTTERSTKK